MNARTALGAMICISITLGGCVGSSNGGSMAYSRDLRQGDALGMYIGHAINQRTLAMRQQQASPAQPVIATGEEPKGE